MNQEKALTPVVDRRYFYRYEDYVFNYDSTPEPYMYEILKRTPQGAWIQTSWLFGSEKKFVLLSAHKKWACETPEQALESYIARKRRQIKILTAQTERAQECLQRALKLSRKERVVA